EYDHADIYPDIGAIQRQFHHLVRIVPGSGRIVWNAADARLAETLAMGCWTPLEGFSREARPESRWSARPARGADDFSRFEVLEPRSHTMRMGVHRQTLPRALAGADQVWLYTPPDLGWDTDVVLTELGARGHVSAEVDALSRELARAVRPGDHVLIMSNGGFGGLHG